MKFQVSSIAFSEESMSFSITSCIGQPIASGRGRSRVLPAWMPLPGGHDEGAMEPKKQRLEEFDGDSSSVVPHQYEDARAASMSATDLNSVVTMTSSASPVAAGHKRKASLMEYADNRGLLSESDARRAQIMQAIQERLSAFLTELRRLVNGGDISRDWAETLLIEAMQVYKCI